MRYIIGIDLGTTNSCVAYVDTHDSRLAVQLFHVPQLVDVGRTEALSTLPSFCYLYDSHEFPKGALSLPWDKKNDSYFVGKFAKVHGAKVPTRLVQSAKSWLCHPAANRRDRILPIEASDEGSRISPVEATARYLGHIKDAWNAIIAKGDIESEFEAQEIVLTVPASFDEMARSLTTEAARKAGFLQMTLLEEPQAAFYSWIAEHESRWNAIFKSGDKILVCDVGGGTTDFSLIDVVSTEGKLSFRRMAVGDHLLLGGDNMDAALAHFLEGRFGKELSPSQYQQLRHAARNAKEQLLEDKAHDPARIVLQGSGSGVVKGTLSAEITRNEVEDKLLNGFFGKYPWEEALKLARTSGLRSMGLPYENEPSIIKHLAHFLWENREGEEPIKPDFIVFNGGAMKPLLFQNAVTEALHAWFPDKPLQKLASFHLDLAVARGAAYYGKARRGLGVKIGGGLPRSYYIVIETDKEKKALTLMPRGAEEGDRHEPSMTFLLKPNTLVTFQICTSHVRLHDKVGDAVPIDPETMHFLPPLHTVIRFGKEVSSHKIPVHLEARLTAIGTLEIGLKSLKTEHHWALDFQVRRASGQDESLVDNDAGSAPSQSFDTNFTKDAENLITQVYSPNNSVKPKQLTESIEKLLNMPRREWSPSVIRGLTDTFLKIADSRKLSADHRERWWNLVGFLLRPGFGYPADDFRMRELWKTVLSDQKGSFPIEQQIQQWICYRRTAGGMSKGQQSHLAADLMASFFSKRGKIEIKSKADLYPYSEKVRALGAMELLDVATKVRIGNALADRIAAGEGIAADYWSLGRIGARHLVYGSIANVVPRDVTEQWVIKILDIPCKDIGHLALLMEQLARKTEHRELNLSSGCVEAILQKFEGTAHHERMSELLLKEISLTQSEQEMVFGDNLPLGLTLEV